ncbi:helix-turn-helix domain-containing protein [Patescibacteria group bacterium]|nr:helix-turn-helix domain-containing protein [Patescibacteria group bacterium]
MILYNIGQKIRDLRRKAGLSLLDVSNKTGLAKSNISSIETNKRNVNKAIVENILIYGLDYSPSQAAKVIKALLKPQSLSANEMTLLTFVENFDFFSGVRVTPSIKNGLRIFLPCSLKKGEPEEGYDFILNEVDKVKSANDILQIIHTSLEPGSVTMIPHLEFLAKFELSLDDLNYFIFRIILARRHQITKNPGAYAGEIAEFYKEEWKDKSLEEVLLICGQLLPKEIKCLSDYLEHIVQFINEKKYEEVRDLLP